MHIPLTWQKIRQIAKLTAKRSREGHLSATRQVFEMTLLRLLYGVGPNYYHQAGFWRYSVRWRDKIQHLGSRAYEKRIYSRNPSRYQKISQNKLVEKALLTLFKIPSPEFLGYLHPTCGTSSHGNPLTTCHDLAQFLMEANHERICFKLPEGSGGFAFSAVQVITENHNVFLRELNNDIRVPLTDYRPTGLPLIQPKGWLIEQYFEQSAWAKTLNPSSVNTLRIWVLAQKPGDLPKTIGAFMRIGREGSMVDNRSSGGLCVPVDLETGKMKAALDGKPTRESFEVHPDHAAQIAGETIPHWNDVKGLAEQALSIFPNICFAGLDIALGESGPAVIELNVYPDKEGAGVMDLPNKRLL